MKTYRFLTCLVVMATSGISSAHASPDTHSGIYLGATYNNVKLKTEGETGPTLGTLSATAGIRYNKHFAMELRAGTGINDDDFGGLY